MRNITFIILFVCGLFCCNKLYSQSFFRKYVLPSHGYEKYGQGRLLIPGDSNRITVLGYQSDTSGRSPWLYAFSLVADSLGDTIATHGDFLPSPSSGAHHPYGSPWFANLIQVNGGGYAFVEQSAGWTPIMEKPTCTDGCIFMNDRMTVSNIDTVQYAYGYGGLFSQNMYSFNNNIIFTGTPFGFVDTAYIMRPGWVPLYAPVWELNDGGNIIWNDSLGYAGNECQDFYSIPVTNSQIAVLGVIPSEKWGAGPDSIRLINYDAAGNVMNNYRCSIITNADSGKLIKLKNNILIIANDSDKVAQRLQLCIEVVDSLGHNFLNVKKYVLNADTQDIIPHAVFATSDSTAIINYSVIANNLNYFLLVNYSGDSVSDFVLPACTNWAYDYATNTILCETDTNNSFVVKDYAIGGLLLYKYTYSAGDTNSHCYNIAVLPEGKGLFIMTGSINDTLFIIRKDSQVVYTNTKQLSAVSYQLSVFPNPSTGIFTISNAGAKNFSRATIEVFDVLGELVFSNHQIIKLSNYQIDLRSQSNGVYFYRVLNDDGSLEGEGKLMIQK